MKAIIKIVGTEIKIACGTAEEMYMMFFHLHPWMDLEVNGDIYKASTSVIYTRDYFKKYFGRA